LHASRTPFDALQFAPGPIICLVEMRDIVDEYEDKLVARQRKIVARADATSFLRYFARMQALSVISQYPNGTDDVVFDWLMMGGPPISAAWSARSAAWRAAWSARSAAESAAWSAACSAAEPAAWSAACSAAESAAWSARSAAESAADSAACSAAESAARSAAERVRLAARSAARSAADSAARQDFNQAVYEAFADYLD
jgi:hypothetical protein